MFYKDGFMDNNPPMNKRIFRLIFVMAILVVVTAGTHSRVALADGPYKTWADELLGLRFSYPAAWGFLSGDLDIGDTGYKYYLNARPEQYSNATGQLVGGGISRDFSEGRDGFYTDFGGFRGRPISAVCRDFGARICIPVSYRVALMVALPKAADVCIGGPGTITEPMMFVGVNLLRNVTVKGFVFLRRLLTPTRSAALTGLLGTGSSNCSVENQRAFDARVAEIYNGILRGTLDAETGQTYREMRYLARSIRFWR
jgi:hypothetical protein